MGIKNSIPRLDAVDKVTGAAKYTEDLIPINALVGKTLHSTIANGTVRAIDVDEAWKIPGVEDILTCFDVPDWEYATCGHPLSLDPAHTDVANKRILTKRVRYYGDEIAAVVAESDLAAQKALEAIRVEYEELPPLLTPEAAVISGIPLHEKSPDNQGGRMDFIIDESQNVRFYQGTFSMDPCIGGYVDLRGTKFHVPAQQHCHIENICCFAYMSGRKIVVVSPNQAPHTLRKHISDALGIPTGRIRVVKPYVGGAFGNKQDMFYEPLAALFTLRLGGRCVAFVMSREETFVNSRTRHAMDIWAAACVDDTGRITQKGIRLNAYSGAYGSNGHAVAAYAVTNYFQLYPALGKQVGESATVYTNMPSAGAMRGYGIPQVAFAMECQMDDLALRYHLDPVEFRKKNMMGLHFLDPFDRFLCASNGLERCIDRGCELVDWQAKRQAYDAFNHTSSNLKKGLGMAVFAYKTGVYPIQLETASCRMLLNDDGSLQIQVCATELGQGSDTVFAQIASEITTIPEENVYVVSCQDTDVSPHDAGAYASRQTYVSGSAVKQTAEILRKKILNRAACLYEADSKDLALDGGRITGRDGAVLGTVRDVAVRMQYTNSTKINSEHLTAESTYTMRHNAFAFGASFVDLEVDVPIGKIKINRVIAIHDSGQILNPALARAQVHGGVAMGIGYALTEQMLFDPETGKMRNDNLLDYKIPTAMDIPQIDVEFVETYEPSAPFGNKALGEPPMIPQAPAIRNAVLHATGVAVYELPLTPERLIHAFIQAGLIQPLSCEHIAET